MGNIKTNKMITYKRGKVEIKGNDHSARWLMFIDLICSNIKWIGITVITAVEVKFEGITTLLKWLSGIP